MTQAAKNYIRGIGSVIDMMPNAGPTRVGRGLHMDLTEYEALQRDWHRLAEDFRVAYEQTIQEAGNHVTTQEAD